MPCFTESDGLQFHTRGSVTGHYPKPDELSSDPFSLLSLTSISILSSHINDTNFCVPKSVYLNKLICLLIREISQQFRIVHFSENGLRH
jgi:hypothetical protein